MKSLIPCFLAALALFKPGKVSCDCNYRGSFMKVARNVDAVVLVKVIRYVPTEKKDAPASASAMEATVLKVYKGKDTKSVITIWGDDGMECRPYVNTFTIGKEYVMALNSTTEGSAKSANYYVSICGEYWLSVNEKRQLIYGNIDSSIRLSSITTLQRFEAQLKQIL